MSTPNASVEQLLVRIAADVTGLKAGMGEAAKSTKQFQDQVKSIDQNLNAFRSQATGAISGLDGVGKALDALQGQGRLSADAISQLTQLLPILLNPVGALTIGMGTLGIGIAKVVEQQQRLKDQEIQATLQEAAEKAKQAAKGWDAYFEAIADGRSKADAILARVRAQEVSGVEAQVRAAQSLIQLESGKVAALEEEAAKIRETIKIFEVLQKDYEKAGPSAAGNLRRVNATIEEQRAKLKANQETIASATIASERATAELERLAEQHAALGDSTDDLKKKLKEEADLLKELADAVRAHADAEQKAFQEREDRSAKSDAERKIRDFFGLPEKESKNPFTAQLKEAQAEHRALMEQVLAAENEGGPIPPDWIERAEALREKILELRDAETEWTEQKQKSKDLLQEEKQLYDELGSAAGDAMGSMVSGAEDAEDAIRKLVAQIVAAIVKMLILRAISSAVGGGPAAGMFANVAGGLVDGASGAIGSGATSGASSSAATSGPGVNIQINESPFLPRSEAEMARMVRTHLKGALEDMVMTGDLQFVTRAA